MNQLKSHFGKAVAFAWAVVCVAPYSPAQAADRLADDPSKEWCYLKKSTTVIGMPFHPQVTEVTYDGSLYTGYSELTFSYGKADTPLLIRQKTFEKGWIPVVGDSWSEDGIDYRIDMFSAPLQPGDVSNCLNFVKIRMKNAAGTAQCGHFTVSLRGRLPDYRLAKLRDFGPADRYEIGRDAVRKNGKLMMVFDSRPDAVESVDGKRYRSAFTADSLRVKPETRTCLLRYARLLQPGEACEIVVKMPTVPTADAAYAEAARQAGYEEKHRFVTDFWERLILSQTQFEIPEKRIQDAQRASMVHLLLATRTRGGQRMQTDGIPYPNFFLTSGPQMSMAYLTNGCPEYARLIVTNALKQQEPDGLYFDRSLAHGGIIPTAHGHIMYMAAAYCLLTHDEAFGRQIFPSLVKAVDYLKTQTGKSRYGLLPPTYPYDNEMIDGHYASNNYWALLGLRFCIRMARCLNRTDVLADWEALEKTYTQSILKGIEASVQADGYVPTGLYDFLTGKKARRGFNEYQCNSDWENMLLAYPTELLPSGHAYVRGSLRHIRKGYAEGIMTYRHGMHLHQYITANLIEQYMVQGQQRQALIDFYHLILHSGSTHEGFENLVIPWKDRMVDPHCPTPHAWASAKTAFLIRNFLLHEYGGRAGMENTRDLYLFPVISPEWARPGQHIAIRGAATEMGPVTARIDFDADGARVSYKADYFGDGPDHVRLRIPYFKRFVRLRTDARSARIEGGCIVLSPDFTTLEVKWQDRPQAHKGTSAYLLRAYRACNTFEGVDSAGVQIVREHRPFLLEEEKTDTLEPLSFDLVRRCFLHEFERRQSGN